MYNIVGVRAADEALRCRGGSLSDACLCLRKLSKMKGLQNCGTIYFGHGTRLLVQICNERAEPFHCKISSSLLMCMSVQR